MLFTDIEGSTALLRELAADYATVLSDQRRIMRAAIATHGGTEMGTEGEQLLRRVPQRAAGVAVACEAQR